MSNVIVPAEIKVSARYKGIVYDKDLNEIHESAWSKNLITGPGLNFLLSATASGDCYFHAVAGTGNNPPSIADTTLQAYAGKYNACQSLVVEKNFTTAPYYVRVTMIHRYYPGAFGALAVNIAEYGMVFNVNSGNSPITATTPIGSRALSVNSGGSPAAVAVQPDEYMDQVYEQTWWIPASALAAISVAVDGVETSTDTEARPSCMNQSPQSTNCWFMPGFLQGSEPSTVGYIRFPRIFPAVKLVGAQLATSSSWVSSGALNGPDVALGGTYATSYECNTVTAATYTTGNYYRDYTFSWGLNNGNTASPIAGAQLCLGLFMWKVSYSPAIAKVVGKKLDLTFRLSIANV
ncbi:MAG: hypothetical protein ACN6O2_01245 [Stenotrophomonas sp.]